MAKKTRKQSKRHRGGSGKGPAAAEKNVRPPPEDDEDGEDDPEWAKLIDAYYSELANVVKYAIGKISNEEITEMRKRAENLVDEITDNRTKMPTDEGKNKLAAFWDKERNEMNKTGGRRRSRRSRRRGSSRPTRRR